MAKELSRDMKDKMSAGQKDSWKDPSKRTEQKNRIKAKKLLKDATSDIIESPNPLNIKVACQALIDEIKKSDEQGWQILIDVLIEYSFMRQRRPLREFLKNLEKAILIKVLSHVNGNLKEATKFLDLKYTTLYEKIKKHNIRFSKSPIED